MMDDIEPGTILAHGGTRYIIESITNGEIEVSELGNRHLSACPVEYGDDCIDPRCDGRVGESLPDTETYDWKSVHELYCFECGLNWVKRSGFWEENYVDWPTSVSFEESENPRSQDAGPNGGVSDE